MQGSNMRMSVQSLLVVMFFCFSSSTATSSNVFEAGKYTTDCVTALTNGLQTMESATSPTRSPIAVPPPKPLLICMPTDAGQFPVLLLIHGYLFRNTFYSQLLQHVASHGFIVIAPQLYTIAGPDATGEIYDTAAVTNWLTEGLQQLLPLDVEPNLAKLALAGHSRGGKTSFALALKKQLTTLKFSALIGIDPVDGRSRGSQTPPPVLTYVPNSFDLDMAVMVIGSGLGAVKRSLLLPACAPEGVNHEDFYNECRAPACYFVAKDYGHVDMLDDITWLFTYTMCKNGKSRKPMRQFTGGIMVAFMKAYLEGDFSSLVAIKNGNETAPVELETADCLGVSWAEEQEYKSML
ncbi:hypothetical protein FNV43_RR01594 [Rhamnella rubrinervis]|uniref:Chlorophyllase n=1 Tax=Rhamnella rubrinervis TaxID=2594499 RepID=A0A8K0HQR7_9ROSA|nr:hypothetical protein FNV43_RR01594 [Rhamnella rubrinervis]